MNSGTAKWQALYTLRWCHHADEISRRISCIHFHHRAFALYKESNLHRGKISGDKVPVSAHMVHAKHSGDPVVRSYNAVLFLGTLLD